MMTAAQAEGPGPAPRAFSLGGYAALLTAFRERGYRAVRFADFDPAAGGRQLILRHDIDMCLDRAVQVARIEADAGMSAAYYVLVSSELYNPSSRRGRAALERIASLGHEIGLHFDAAAHFEAPDAAAPDELDAAVAREARLLEGLVGRTIGSMSFHRPIKAFQGRPGTVGGLFHAYEPRFFHDIAYVSDSQGRWRFGHPLDHPAVAAGQPLQLLTHPVWWAGNEPATPIRRLDRLVEDADARFRQELARNCTPYRERLPGAGSEQ